MASSSMETTPRRPPLTIRDVDDDGFISEEEEEEEEDERDMSSKRVSRLSMDGSDGGDDADDEDDGYRLGDCVDEEEEDEVGSGVSGAAYRYHPWPPYEEVDGPARTVPSSASLPGTPDRGAPWRWRWLPGGASGNKEYASETEARRRPPGTGRRRERVTREVRLERAWRVRKQQELLGEVPVVVVHGLGEPSQARTGVAMDVEEVRACRDLGLDLPCDWSTVDILPWYADTASSGANSPASGSWRISSPGDDPEDVKARLKMWAQAVALASASRLGVGGASPLHI